MATLRLSNGPPYSPGSKRLVKRQPVDREHLASDRLIRQRVAHCRGGVPRWSYVFEGALDLLRARQVVDVVMSKYQQSYRRMLVDMHIPDWDPAFLSRYDPAALAGQFTRANLTGAMLYCKSHAGLCYWPTRAGKMHAGIGGRDLVGEMLTELRSRGIAACAYYSIVFDNWAVETHPDWRQRTINGADFNSVIRYGTCCMNHPEYRAYEMAQLDDLLSRYEFDALFLDMIFWPLICGCDHCRARFRAEADADIPVTVDWTSPAWCRFQAARERWASDFTRDLMAKAKSIRPDLDVTHNLAPGAFQLGAGAAARRVDSRHLRRRRPLRRSRRAARRFRRCCCTCRRLGPPNS